MCKTLLQGKYSRAVFLARMIRSGSWAESEIVRDGRSASKLKGRARPLSLTNPLFISLLMPVLSLSTCYRHVSFLTPSLWLGNFWIAVRKNVQMSKLSRDNRCPDAAALRNEMIQQYCGQHGVNNWQSEMTRAWPWIWTLLNFSKSKIKKKKLLKFSFDDKNYRSGDDGTLRSV